MIKKTRSTISAQLQPIPQCHGHRPKPSILPQKLKIALTLTAVRKYIIRADESAFFKPGKKPFEVLHIITFPLIKKNEIIFLPAPYLYPSIKRSGNTINRPLITSAKELVHVLHQKLCFG